MAPAIIDLKNSNDPQDVVHRAIEALAGGKLVAIPTETVYGVAASALNEEAVERLLEAKRRSRQKAFALAIKSVDDALDYVPDMSPLAQRLGRRCWPGPLTLVVEDNHPDSVISRLPDSVQRAVVPDTTVGLRVPMHAASLQILRMSAGPLVLTSANISGSEDAMTAEQVLNQLGDSIDFVIDDGPSRFGQPSSVVQVQDEQLKILREGVITRQVLNEMTNYIVLLVCTGNTCRSPMAEGLLKRRIAHKLNCQPGELNQNNVSVISAGISSYPGSQASQQAVDVMNSMGIDISTHSSQVVTDELARQADIILTMTSGHRQAMLARWPDLATRIHLVCRDGHDVSDPIGQSEQIYRKCAEEIDANLAQWVEQLDFK